MALLHQIAGGFVGVVELEAMGEKAGKNDVTSGRAYY
jgi:hypothetical protein